MRRARASERTKRQDKLLTKLLGLIEAQMERQGKTLQDFFDSMKETLLARGIKLEKKMGRGSRRRARD